MWTKLAKTMLLCMLGGAIYCFLELLWRGYTHWSMFVVAALITISLDHINKNEPMQWNIPIWMQAIQSGLGITLAELIAGIILNIHWKLRVWDYSHLPFQLWGQICLSYSLVWIFISGVGIVLFDWLRWKLFGEKMPHYKWRLHAHIPVPRPQS